jgi:PspAA-like protein
MIVRIATEGQYELADDAAERLNALDNEAAAAAEQGEQAAFATAFGRMIELIRAEGRRLPDDELRGSDVIVPPSDTSFEEARNEFSGDGLIPG